jgi:hypothetical protein
MYVRDPFPRMDGKVLQRGEVCIRSLDCEEDGYNYHADQYHGLKSLGEQNGGRVGLCGPRHWIISETAGTSADTAL